MLPIEAIATMLELPPEYEVHHLFMDPYCDAVCVAIVSDRLDEVPSGAEMPRLPISDWIHLVDTTPVLDALRKLHYLTDGGQCLHCEDEWPCPTMKVAEDEALARPLVMRRLRVEIGEPTP